MMPPDPNDKMDELLKAFAQKRREQSGAPFALHPATRKLLQAEVARLVPRPVEKKWKPPFYFRLFFTAAAAALIAICALISFSGEHSAPEQNAFYLSAAKEPPAVPPVAPVTAPSATPEGGSLAFNEPSTPGDAAAEIERAMPARKAAPVLMPETPADKVDAVHVADMTKGAVTITLSPPATLSGSAADGGAGGAALLSNSLNGADISLNNSQNQAQNQGELASSSTDLKKLFADADGFYASGRYYLAYKRYAQILNIDQYNVAARRGEEKVLAAKQKYADESYNTTRGYLGWVLKSKEEVTPRKYVGHEVAKDASADAAGNQKSIQTKLDSIIIPKIELKEVTLREAIDFLRKESVDLDATETDPARKGVNIVLKLESAPAPGAPAAVFAAAKPAGDLDHGADTQKAGDEGDNISPGDARITLSLTNIPLSEALRYITSLAGAKVKIEPYTVAIVPLSVETDEFITKEYQVPKGLFTGTQTAREYLETSGVTFPPGASAKYDASNGKLAVHNTTSNIDLTDQIVDANAAPPELTEQLEDFEKSPGAVNFRKTKDLKEKLDHIIIPKIEFHDTKVQEALAFLQKKAVELDPTLKGVNIVLKLGVPPAEGGDHLAAADATASTAGLRTDGVVSPGDTKIDLSLTNIPLSEALRYVTALSGLKMRIDAYAINVVPLSEPTDTLITKEYNVPPGFLVGAEAGAGFGGGNIAAKNVAAASTPETAAISRRVTAKTYLEQAGVQFPAGAAANFLPAGGKLVVRNTESNLDMVDQIFENYIEVQLSQAKKLAANKALQNEEQKMATPGILTTFQLQLEGDNVRLIDADGSTYSGKIEQPSLQKQIAVSNGRTFTNVAPVNQAITQSNNARQIQMQQNVAKNSQANNVAVINGQNVTQGLQQNGMPQQNFSFRAAGISRRLNKPVIFEGNYIAADLPQEQAQAQAIFRAKSTNAELLKDKADIPVLNSNARIQGQAQVGDSGKIDIDAVVVPLKTKAGN